MSNWIALKLDRQGLAEMSCIAGVGGDVKPLVKKALEAEVLIGIDGCPLHCVKSCLGRHERGLDEHFDLKSMGVTKESHGAFDLQKAQEVYQRIAALIKSKYQDDV